MLAPLVKKEAVKGKGKENEMVEVLADVSPPKKRMRVEYGCFGEVERDKYVPA